MRHAQPLILPVLLATLFAFTTTASSAQEAASGTEAKPKAAAEKATGTEKAAEKKPTKVRLAHIKISGELPESPGQMSLFGDLGIDLRKTIARLDKAAKDDRIAGVVLEIQSAALGRGKLNELRAAIKRVQAADKKVYATTESAMGPQYVLASACDEVIMPEAGVLVIPGVRLELAYYKEMLGKLGIEADIMHVGESKGAGETFTRTNMSEPVRKNLTAMVDDFYDQLVTTIATDRDLKVDHVRELVGRWATHRHQGARIWTAGSPRLPRRAKSTAQRRVQGRRVGLRRQLCQEGDRHRFLQIRLHDQAVSANDGRQRIGQFTRTEDRGGLRRRTDHEW